VRLKQKTLGIRQIAKSVIGGLLMASLLFSVALASSPALHEYFHHDAGNEHHACAATLCAHGQFMSADTAPMLAVVVLLFLFCVLPARFAEFYSVDLRLDFGRAPPHFSSLR